MGHVQSPDFQGMSLNHGALWCHPGGLFNDSPSDKLGWSSNLNFQDIDNDHSDPQMCSMYATDIYVHLRMAEVRFLT